MNDEDQMMHDLGDSIPTSTPEDKIRPQATTDGPPKRRRLSWDCDVSRPLKDPGYEAVAQFLATPKQFRQFKSCTALAKHLKVSRTTIYRWAQEFDVAKRTVWLMHHNVIIGDSIVSREWPGIVAAQVKAALSGDIRAAIFCQNRTPPVGSAFKRYLEHPLEDALWGATNITALVEEAETSEPEEPRMANKNPEMLTNRESEE